jgi:hypothetical protein
MRPPAPVHKPQRAEPGSPTNGRATGSTSQGACRGHVHYPSERRETQEWRAPLWLAEHGLLAGDDAATLDRLELDVDRRPQPEASELP